MRSKDKTLMAAIEKFVSDYTDSNGISPTMQEVADGVGSSKATVQRYIAQLCEDGILDYSGYRTMTSTKTKAAAIRVPVLGTIACGIPKFAEENIEEYVRLPVALFGKGNFFILRAYGDSMIEAGIENGDLVLIRQQNYADEGQIVVALMEDEATLKRFYPEPKKHRIRLHPENSRMDDIYVDNCEIQGVAVKVLKDLE
ncbi:transcriptional repressor LexA [Faecalibacterium sp.]|jgi:repressor LexA|uniref:transcriptional repressor LexA n=1 Tax=Faecalibacterium sp. TaxID=1971605 RepID=UPI0025BA86E5|nr:transcriptional repressor LexA [Faecalibacterium sp.]